MSSILASTLPQLATLTPMTGAFEAPNPFTYPRYRIEGGQLRAIDAPFEELGQLRKALANPAEWAAFRAVLRRSALRVEAGRRGD